MKKYYFFSIVLFLSSLPGYSQNPTPNPGFENWLQTGNHYDPINWNTLNPSTSVVGVLTVTRATGADVHSGTYALKLTTKSVFNLTANGIASTGTIITTPPYGVTGGIAFSGRPDSIAGWYKCAPQPGDTGFAQILLMDANGDTVGFSRWWAPPFTVGNYTRFSHPINYYNNSTPATAQWILSSSKGFNQVVNSNIIFDDISLITNPVGVQELHAENQASVVPSVTPGLFYVHNNTGKKIQVLIYNVPGQLIQQEELTESAQVIHLDTKPKGIYLYEIRDLNNNRLTSGKMVNN